MKYALLLLLSTPAFAIDDAQQKTIDQVKTIMAQTGHVGGDIDAAFTKAANFETKQLEELLKNPDVIRAGKKTPFLIHVIKHRISQVNEFTHDRPDHVMGDVFTRKLREAGFVVRNELKDSGGSGVDIAYKENGGVNPDIPNPSVEYNDDTTISNYMDVCQPDGSGCVQVQTRLDGVTAYFDIRTDLLK